MKFSKRNEISEKKKNASKFMKLHIVKMIKIRRYIR